jgi:hypothetical protein
LQQIEFQETGPLSIPWGKQTIDGLLQLGRGIWTLVNGGEVDDRDLGGDDKFSEGLHGPAFEGFVVSFGYTELKI